MPLWSGAQLVDDTTLVSALVIRQTSRGGISVLGNPGPPAKGSEGSETSVIFQPRAVVKVERRPRAERLHADRSDRSDSSKT